MSLKTKRALTVLVGWLEAAKIPFEVRGESQVLVRGKESHFVQISDVPSEGTFYAADFCSSTEKALSTFWAITERAGFGRPQILKRGFAPKRVKYKNDPELVAMRHREFRQVANLPSHVYRDINYQKIIKWYCFRFLRSNQDLCRCVGYEIEDIETYAWLYLTNFYGRWRHVNATSSENGKMFCSYLQQRLYSDLKPLLLRKNKNISVDIETAKLGQNVEYWDQWESNDGAYNRKVPVPVAKPQEEKLEDIVENMDHTQLLGLLTDLVNQGNSKAKKFLVVHRAECLECACRVECRNTNSLS